MAKKTSRSQKEKRQYPRVPTSILLDVREPDPDAKKTGGMVVDLSLGGLAFESGSKLAAGTDLFIGMEMPLALFGRIVHAFPNGDKYRYGVRFMKLGLFDERKVKKYISLRLRKG